MWAEPKIMIVDGVSDVATEIAEFVATMGGTSQVFASAEEFLDEERSSRPECVVLADALCGMQGTDLLERLAETGDRLPVVLLVSHPTTAQVVRAMKAGAINVLEEAIRENELWRAIEEAIAVSTAQQSNFQNTQHLRRSISNLPPQVREVLDMVVEGIPNKQIARQLQVSIRTVESRRAQIFRALDANSIAELVRKTVEARLADEMSTSGV